MAPALPRYVRRHMDIAKRLPPLTRRERKALARIHRLLQKRGLLK